jgi:hypothetical protein
MTRKSYTWAWTACRTTDHSSATDEPRVHGLRPRGPSPCALKNQSTFAELGAEKVTGSGRMSSHDQHTAGTNAVKHLGMLRSMYIFAQSTKAGRFRREAAPSIVGRRLGIDQNRV